MYVWDRECTHTHAHVSHGYVRRTSLQCFSRLGEEGSDLRSFFFQIPMLPWSYVTPLPFFRSPVPSFLAGSLYLEQYLYREKDHSDVYEAGIQNLNQRKILHNCTSARWRTISFQQWKGQTLSVKGKMILCTAKHNSFSAAAAAGPRAAHVHTYSTDAQAHARELWYYS